MFQSTLWTRDNYFFSSLTWDKENAGLSLWRVENILRENRCANIYYYYSVLLACYTCGFLFPVLVFWMNLADLLRICNFAKEALLGQLGSDDRNQLRKFSFCREVFWVEIWVNSIKSGWLFCQFLLFLCPKTCVPTCLLVGVTLPARVPSAFPGLSQCLCRGHSW